VKLEVNGGAAVHLELFQRTERWEKTERTER
jgi:hypothetical protein